MIETSGMMAVLHAATLAAPSSANEAAEFVAPVAGPWWIALIPLMPIVGTILATLCAIRGIKTKLPAFLTVGCLATSFLLTVAMFLNLGDAPTITTAWEWFTLTWGEGEGQTFTANVGFYVDSLTALWMLFVTALGTLMYSLA